MSTRQPRSGFLVTWCVALIVGLALSVVAGHAREPSRIEVTTATGRHPLTIEWASTPSERERGLMGRKTLPEGHGMLFDFGDEEPVYFWMKNTPLSLDMIFIKADGTTSRIEKRTTPFSEALIPGGAPVRYVLELVGGSADRIGLRPGDHFAIPAR
ncbi:hypothetical protein K32_22420 [Kaistia sp. 32K]|uniref:DUF192 domain-containing protein n=1 Tax=Kaistia sp. 32K TaxID=2795690 RepID=UPI0019166E0B|nr:DUF192 domain-containing protein [Kaistia sp. 32K]BCP53625.1 hypothetical protein K32_22420 [Kaistia sp. 32K]